MLAKLQRSPEALDYAYKGALDRINGQMRGYRDLARRALSWITYAQRLLTTEELQHALAIEPGESSLDYQNINDAEEIASGCAGLVTIDEESSIIRLTHYTTQEYLERVQSKWNPSAQEKIAEACFTYLLFNVFQSGSCASVEAFKQRLAENPFFEYSARYWSRHIQPIRYTCLASKLALDFLCNDTLIESVSQVVSVPTYRYYSYYLKFTGRLNGVHLVAEHGLSHIARLLLERKSGNTGLVVDSKDSNRRTPLQLAARGGHEAVVQLLLATGQVDVDSKDNYGRSALQRAAERGHEAVVQLLLATRQVDIDSSTTLPLSQSDPSNQHLDL